MVDRLSVRSRPSGTPIMHQTWNRLLFLHWKVDPGVIRGRVPAGLEIDQFEGAAWIGITPFTISGIRPAFLPPAPVISRAHELNVRTYVIGKGVPGVWFLSLDADSALAVRAARIGFRLPYFDAEIGLKEINGVVEFRSRRIAGAGRLPSFACRWRRGEPIAPPAPGTLDFFLIERYCLYAAADDKLYRARIHHRPWSLRKADLIDIDSTMLEAQGLPSGEGAPLVHAQGDSQNVEIWPLEQIDQNE